MFKVLFLATLLVTLVVNIIFLFATKDNQLELPSTSTLVSVIEIKNEGPKEGQSSPLSSVSSSTSQARRLFLRSNDFYDYSSSAALVLPSSSHVEVQQQPDLNARGRSASSSEPVARVEIGVGSVVGGARRSVVDNSISNQNDKRSRSSSIVETTSAINYKDKVSTKRTHHNESGTRSHRNVSEGTAQKSNELRSDPSESVEPSGLDKDETKEKGTGETEAEEEDGSRLGGNDNVNLHNRTSPARAYQLRDLSEGSLTNQISSVPPNRIERTSGDTNATAPLTSQQLNGQDYNYNIDSKSDNHLIVELRQHRQHKYPSREQDQLKQHSAEPMQAIIQKQPKEFERKQSPTNGGSASSGASGSDHGNGNRTNGANSIYGPKRRRVHWQVRGVSGTEMANEGVDNNGDDIKPRAEQQQQQFRRHYHSDDNDGRALNIRVESSKNLVFISVENIIIYQSKTRPTRRVSVMEGTNWQQQQRLPRTSSAQILKGGVSSSSTWPSLVARTGNGIGVESDAVGRSSHSLSSSSVSSSPPSSLSSSSLAGSNVDVNSSSERQSSHSGKAFTIGSSSFPLVTSSSYVRASSLSQTSLPEAMSMPGRRNAAMTRQTSTEPAPPADDNGEPEVDGSEARGVHVVVLNEYDGRIMSKRVFDTYLPNQDEELCFYLNMIRDGRILVFAIKDEGTFKMAASSPARALLQRLGSRHIMNVQWRDMWAFVARKTSLPETNQVIGRPARQLLEENALRANLAEGLSKSPSFSEWAKPVIIDTRVELVEPKFKLGGTNSGTAFAADGLPSDCQWNSGDIDEDRRRANFCTRVEGYGRVCDCKHPDPISFKPAKIANSQLTQVPIVVIASDRPHYLYRMLSSLLSADGVDRSLITVFIDGYYDEPLMVCQLFNLRAVQQKPLARKSARISHHYKSSLTATFELFPDAQFAIIFEEDLDVARDALIYFNQTLELLKHDPSLYCVSAWNDQGYEHSANDATLIYRVETMPGLGWMLSRDLYKRELEPEWPSASQLHDWDMWIRTSSVRKGRECLIPDISRTYHFGSTGTNINSYFQSQYFSGHAFSLVPQKRFANLDKLTRDAYENLIESLIVQARVVRRRTGSEQQISSDMSKRANRSNDDEHYLCSLASKATATGSLGIRTATLSSAFAIHSAATRSRINGPTWQTTDGSKLNDQRASNSTRGSSVKRSTQTDNILDDINGTANVIYIQMIDTNDYKNWLKLAQCWHIWDLDVRGQHKCMWRLFLRGEQTLVVGVPASPYSRFKPSDLVPFDL